MPARATARVPFDVAQGKPVARPHMQTGMWGTQGTMSRKESTDRSVCATASLTISVLLVPLADRLRNSKLQHGMQRVS